MRFAIGPCAQPVDYLFTVMAAAALLFPPALRATVLTTRDGTLRVETQSSGAQAQMEVLLRSGTAWQPVLGASSSSVRVTTEDNATSCTTYSARIDVTAKDVLVLSGKCSVGSYTQRIHATDESGVLAVVTVVTLSDQAPTLRSIEDRYSFLPPRRASDDPAGPLDFIWSQNIKNEADGVIPTGAFKSPAVMLQQGRAFAALLPKLSDRQGEPLALDLDVTSDALPWLAYGEIPSQGYGHNYFRRAPLGGTPSAQLAVQPKIVAHTVQYAYEIVVSTAAERQGYRRVVHRLWQTRGRPALLNSPDLQRNVIRPDLSSFETWRADAWDDYAPHVYHAFNCDGRTCGTLSSNRNPYGDWTHRTPDAWFNAWFETLRTAYGWYLHGRAIQDPETMRKAESVLTLAESAPQKQGAFPSIYLLQSRQWIRDDGWAGYAEDYHAFDMSWTAYWMLRWVEDLTPSRRQEVLHYITPYADFLLREQLPNGVIPSWYGTDLKPRAEFRDFNAETGASALFLAALGRATGDARYIAASSRALDFITREVLPRQRWFDFETYLSCARKDYGFYDKWTAQFPQNNLAEMQTAQAFLELYRTNHSPATLATGLQVLDYFLLTQQVWNNPSFTPLLVGGFTTQNTDAEWSDARQGQAATLLFDYYRETGEFEYLERAVAAARSTFSVAPWENWAHDGVHDRQGALTGFHWGTGSAMTSVEMMTPMLGDGLIDVAHARAVGFDECTLRDVFVMDGRIAFRLESRDADRSFHLRFIGANPKQTYRVAWNGGPDRSVRGSVLLQDGLTVMAADRSR